MIEGGDLSRPLDEIRRSQVSQPDCLFCGVAGGQVPATLVHEDDDLVAFRDINPQAPVHILIIPRQHIASLEAAGDEHADLLGRLLLTARDLARSEGLADDGYRAVLNIGADGGQTVHHIHLHLVGGRALGWPPG
jgi:histidine triad (HIT) family protein